MSRHLEKLRFDYASACVITQAACVMRKPMRLPAALAAYPSAYQSFAMRQSMRASAIVGHFSLQPLAFSLL
jgi:hypothetical protein